MEDPHFEYERHTENGCRIRFVQYLGPNAGGQPLYEGRFNQAETPDIEQQDLTISRAFYQNSRTRRSKHFIFQRLGLFLHSPERAPLLTAATE